METDALPKLSCVSCASPETLVVKETKLLVTEIHNQFQMEDMMLLCGLNNIRIKSKSHLGSRVILEIQYLTQEDVENLVDNTYLGLVLPYLTQPKPRRYHIRRVFKSSRIQRNSISWAFIDRAITNLVNLYPESRFGVRVNVENMDTTCDSCGHINKEVPASCESCRHDFNAESVQIQKQRLQAMMQSIITNRGVVISKQHNKGDFASAEKDMIFNLEVIQNQAVTWLDVL